MLSDLHYAVKWSASIERYDLKKKLPHADGSIDFVYSSHFLEHLPVQLARQLMKEVFRVLRPGGVARIVVPDLAFGARQYLNAIQENPNAADAATAFLEWLQLARTGVRDSHYWMYDAHSLSAMLEEIGFTSVVVCQYRIGRVPDCDILDNRPEDSLHLEAEKP
jgi:predicted SAM-dependent methyltransferase